MRLCRQVNSRLVSARMEPVPTSAPTTGGVVFATVLYIAATKDAEDIATHGSTCQMVCKCEFAGVERHSRAAQTWEV